MNAIEEKGKPYTSENSTPSIKDWIDSHKLAKTQLLTNSFKCFKYTNCIQLQHSLSTATPRSLHIYKMYLPQLLYGPSTATHMGIPCRFLVDGRPLVKERITNIDKTFFGRVQFFYVKIFYWEAGHHTSAYWQSWGVSRGKPCGFSFWPVAKFCNKKILVYFSS